MQNPKLIIEIDKEVDKKYLGTLKAIIESVLEIPYENKVEIFEANTYAFQSNFSKTIFEQYSKAIADSLD